MSENDASSIVFDESRVTLQIVASLTGDSRGVNYYRNMFIVEATARNLPGATTPSFIATASVTKKKSFFITLDPPAEAEKQLCLHRKLSLARTSGENLKGRPELMSSNVFRVVVDPQEEQAHVFFRRALSAWPSIFICG